MEWIGQHRNLFSLERHIAEYSSNFGTSGGMQWTSVPCFLWCTGSCFLYWTLAWKLKRAGWIVLSLKIKKTVACLKSPQRQLIVKKWWSQLELNQRYKNFQSFALPAELWDHMIWIKVVGRAGFEPAVYLTSRFYRPLASTNLHIYPEWRWVQDSNLRSI